MSMAAAFSAAIDTLYTMYGEIVSYEAKDAIASGARIVITEDLSTWGDDITVTNDQVGITVRRSEVVEKPRRGDTFTTTGGTVYRVEQALRQPNEFEWRLLAVTDGC